MENLEANSKSIQPETENTRGNKTNSKLFTAESGEGGSGTHHPDHPQGPHRNPSEEDAINNASPIPDQRTESA